MDWIGWFIAGWVGGGVSALVMVIWRHDNDDDEERDLRVEKKHNAIESVAELKAKCDELSTMVKAMSGWTAEAADIAVSTAAVCRRLEDDILHLPVE